MAWYQIFYDICGNLRTSNKNKTERTMKDKSLYELSQNPEWHNKWSVRHLYGRGDMPASSRLGSILISHPSDCSNLAESTRATLQGKSKPFSPSKETLAHITKL